MSDGVRGRGDAVAAPGSVAALVDELAELLAASDRKSQVGSGDRSEKIRTYNFQQARVTDHRIGLTIHRLHEVLDGDLGEIVNSLIAHAQAEKLKDAKPGASEAAARR